MEHNNNANSIDTNRFTNRLSRETSPYLLQHAHNPVDWYPWCEEAFDRAQKENRPVFLSVGYSTCHWCHVMERESFEDEEIASCLNENYIAIKVDREERPDIDDCYMKAAMLFTGGGGWPMTVVLTPDRKPFFAGTYFPARDGDRGARMGLLTILRSLHQIYSDDKERAVQSADQVTKRIQQMVRPDISGPIPGIEALGRAADQLAADFDSQNGGFRPSPKFPMPSTLDLLMRHYLRKGEKQSLNMVILTLEKMAMGGIYDHVGGGFHRYSTDERWLVPHFEKMLYDNAQLVTAYLEAYQITGREDFAQTARETLDYVMREMSAQEGGFYSATDADSSMHDGGESEEGLFFTWTMDELLEVLGEKRAGVVAEYFGVTKNGNFEGRNILYTPIALNDFSVAMNRPQEDILRELAAAKSALYAARQLRPKPLLDDKIIAAWNGLMISAFALAARVLCDEKYVMRATLAADFIIRGMKKDGKLFRTFRNGSCRHEGTLSDYAFVIAGLIDLFETTHDLQRLEEAAALQAVVDENFGNAEGGGYCMTHKEHESLLSRAIPDSDGAEPSGNSVTVFNLLRLAAVTDDNRYRLRAEETLRSFSAGIHRGAGASKMIGALDFYLDTPVEVVIIEKTKGAASLFEKALSRLYLPNRIVIVAAEGEDLTAKAKKIPLLQGKQVTGESVIAFICKDGTCELPTSDLEVFEKQLYLSVVKKS
jgi:uncharacterized protein YyaL (SSP411 family)